MKKTCAMFAFVGAAAMASGAVAGIELTNNGGFEAGDTSGWESFPTATSTFNVTNDADTGTFAAELFNNAPASGAVIKQANLGVGQVQIGDTVTVSFAAKGSGAAGGVAFAEFFTELDGGGTSSSQILTGGPLMLTDEYQDFSFDIEIMSDVSGGVSLQFVAATGADEGSVSVLFVDSVSVVPAPGAFAGLAGLGGLALMRRRR